MEYSRNFRKNRKFWPKSKFFGNFTWMEYFRNFDQNRNFTKILTKIEILRKYFDFGEIFQKFQFFGKFFKIPIKSNIRNLTKIEIFRNFWKNIIFLKILTKIEIFQKFDQNWIFSKIWPKSKFCRKFDQNSYLLTHNI